MYFMEFLESVGYKTTESKMVLKKMGYCNIITALKLHSVKKHYNKNLYLKSLCYGSPTFLPDVWLEFKRKRMDKDKRRMERHTNKGRRRQRETEIDRESESERKRERESKRSRKNKEILTLQ